MCIRDRSRDGRAAAAAVAGRERLFPTAASTVGIAGARGAFSGTGGGGTGTRGARPDGAGSARPDFGAGGGELHAERPGRRQQRVNDAVGILP